MFVDIDFVIIEIGMNYFGEIELLVCFVCLYVVMIIIVVVVYFEVFGVIEGIVCEKGLIFCGLVQFGMVIIFEDLFVIQILCDFVDVFGVIVVGFGVYGMVCLVKVDMQDGIIQVCVCIFGEIVYFIFVIVGMYFVMNVVGVFVVLLVVGVDFVVVGCVLFDWCLFLGCGVFEDLGGICLIDDVYNLNLILFLVGLVMLVWLMGGCCVVIFGDMLELGLDELVMYVVMVEDVVMVLVDLVYIVGLWMWVLYQVLFEVCCGLYVEIVVELVLWIGELVVMGDIVFVKGLKFFKVLMVVDVLCWMW